MKPTPVSTTRTPEDGFTLIELLVYVSLFVVVLIIVGGFMISSLEAERDVAGATEATDTAQLIATSVQAGVRNGSGLRVETASSGDQMLVARTATRDAAVGWVCQVWYYSASNESMYTKSSGIPAATIPWPASSPAGRWTLLGEGVTPIEDGGTVFGPTGNRPTSGRALATPSASVTMAYEVATDDAPTEEAGADGDDRKAPVRVETSVSTRIEEPAGAPCFS